MHWQVCPSNSTSAHHLASVSRISTKRRRPAAKQTRRANLHAKLIPHSPVEFSGFAVQLHPFTSERFHALFTLSSKYFSTFPHGTCSLSDSCTYLALDGVYHPLWAAISNNPTQRFAQRSTGLPDLHPHGPFTLFGPCPYYRTHFWT